MNDRQPVVDHDPDEPPRDTSRSPWFLVAVILGLLWAGYFYSFPIDWVSIGLGFGTGMMFMAWAIEITGNRVPASWRRKPSNTRRP